MEMTKNLDELIAAYEKERGISISQGVRKLFEVLSATGDNFEELGKTEALKGNKPRSEEAFFRWGEHELADPRGKDKAIVELMYMCYMDGYRKGCNR